MKTIQLLAPLRTTDTPRGKQFYVYQYYINMFKKINAELIFITPSSYQTYQQFMEICDGLLLAGGLDIDASYYHEINHPSNQLELKEVDQMDFDLIQLCYQMHKPIIGICRGHQIINVAFGGTLYQDINSQYETTINHSQSIHQVYCHDIHVVENTTLANYLSCITLVNSYHHQNIKDLAPGFKVMAYSDDGLIEAIEKDNIVSIQWHPEKVNDDNQDKIVDMFLQLFVKTNP